MNDDSRWICVGFYNLLLAIMFCYKYSLQRNSSGLFCETVHAEKVKKDSLTL